MRWKSSAFRCCPGPSEREVNVGVRWISSRMTSAARRTSSGVTGASGIWLDARQSPVDRFVGDDVPHGRGADRHRDDRRGQPSSTAGPHRRHGRPRALADDRLLPPDPRDPAPDRGRTVGLRGRARLDHPLDRARLRATGARVAAALRRQLRPVLRAGERLPPHRGFAVAAVRRQRRLSHRRRTRRRAAAVATNRPAAALPRAAAVAPCRRDRRRRVVRRRAMDGLQRLSGRLVGRSERRRSRRHGGVSRVVCVRRQGTHAARPPRPRRIRDRVHGAGELVPVPRHRRLPDHRPQPCPPHGVAAAPAGSAPAHRPPRAVAPDGLLPAPPRPAAHHLAAAVVARRAPPLDRRVGDRARDRPRARKPPPLPRRVDPVRDARRRLPLPHRWPLPGLHRRRRELSRRPRARSAAAPAPCRDVLPLLPRVPGAPPRVRVHGRRLRGGVPRLVGGARHRPHAGGDPQPRSRGSPLLRPGERVPLPPHRSLPVLGARPAGPAARRAARTCARATTPGRSSRFRGSSPPESRGSQRRCRGRGRRLARLRLAPPPHRSPVRPSPAAGGRRPRLRQGRRPRGGSRGALLPRHVGARADRALRDAMGLRAARAAVRARVGRRADRHRDAARDARPRHRLARRAAVHAARRLVGAAS